MPGQPDSVGRVGTEDAGSRGLQGPQVLPLRGGYGFAIGVMLKSHAHDQVTLTEAVHLFCYHVLSFVCQTPCFSRDSFLKQSPFFLLCAKKIRMPGLGLPWWSSS